MTRSLRSTGITPLQETDFPPQLDSDETAMTYERFIRSGSAKPVANYYGAVRPSPTHQYFRPRGWSRLCLVWEINRQLSGWNSSSTDDSRLRGALPQADMARSGATQALHNLRSSAILPSSEFACPVAPCHLTDTGLCPTQVLLASNQTGGDMAGGKAWLRRAVLVLPMLPIGAGVSTNVWADGLTPGDLVISTVTGSSLDAASAITLFQFVLTANGTTATPAGSLTLPQTSSGANQAISGEYGLASEGFLTQSVNQQYLTIMGYGVNASTFNSAPVATYGTAALGQTTSLTGQSVTTVPRVVALIGADGSVNTTTALTGVFNTNNPRSAVTVDGSAFYVSGQGASKTDTTQGYSTPRSARRPLPLSTTARTRARSPSPIRLRAPTPFMLPAITTRPEAVPRTTRMSAASPAPAARFPHLLRGWSTRISCRPQVPSPAAATTVQSISHRIWQTA